MSHFNGRSSTNIDQTGLIELRTESVTHTAAIVPSPARPAKRAYIEVADSDEEDFGSDDGYSWMDEDEVAAEVVITNHDDTPSRPLANASNTHN